MIAKQGYAKIESKRIFAVSLNISILIRYNTSCAIQDKNRLTHEPIYIIWLTSIINYACHTNIVTLLK